MAMLRIYTMEKVELGKNCRDGSLDQGGVVVESAGILKIFLKIIIGNFKHKSRENSKMKPCVPITQLPQ